MSGLQRAVSVALAAWDGKTDKPLRLTMEELREHLLQERETAKQRQRARRGRIPAQHEEE